MMSIVSLVQAEPLAERKSNRGLDQCLFVYLAPSPVTGIGLFTTIPYTSGDEVLRVNDPEYFAAARSHAQLSAAGYTHEDIFQVGDDLFIPPHGTPDDYTNHSCEPNTGLKVSSAGFVMIALRDIAAHEELTYDYSTHQEHPLEDMMCCCGTVSCRRVIRSFSTLPKALRDRYLQLGVVSDFAARAVSE
jgi:uncharacterized protein